MQNKITYRKMDKKDYKAVMRFIEDANVSRWECDGESTKKRLTRLYLYSYLLCSSYSVVAVYRGSIVGVMLIGNEKHSRIAPVIRLKKLFSTILLKVTKEGRTNLKNLNQINEMKRHLSEENKLSEQEQILLLYVNKNYTRKSVGKGLLDSIEKEEKKGITVFINQHNNKDFLVKYGFKEIADTEQMMEINGQRYKEKMILYVLKGF